MDFDFGSLFEQLVTRQNLIIVLACGGVMEAFKRGPLTKRFAASKPGLALEFYAPVVWCWIALFLPVGLAPEGATIGSKFTLGIVLGMATDSAHDWLVKSLQRLLGAPSSSPPGLALPDEKKKP